LCYFKVNSSKEVVAVPLESMLYIVGDTIMDCTKLLAHGF
jgi:hypothetical protein